MPKSCFSKRIHLLLSRDINFMADLTKTKRKVPDGTNFSDEYPPLLWGSKEYLMAPGFLENDDG